MTSQKLRGLVGQGMDGRKAHFTPYTSNFPIGSHTFSAPLPGYYRFVMWGGGNAGTAGSVGASGGYSEVTVSLGYGEQVTVTVGAAGVPGGAGGGASSITAKGRTYTAGTDGDYVLAATAAVATGGTNGNTGAGTGGGAGGTAAGTESGGAGAPGRLPFRGGDGGAGSGSGHAESPGGGGGQIGTTAYGGDGLVIVERLPSRPVYT